MQPKIAFLFVIIVCVIIIVLFLDRYIFYKVNNLISVDSVDVDDFNIAKNKIFKRVNEVFQNQDSLIDSVTYDDNSGIANGLDGPFMPADCQQTKKICLNDDQCKILCKDSIFNKYICDNDTLMCVVKNTTETVNETGDISIPENVNCNTKRGEFAVIQGYNELGTAQWNCIQLYPGWQNTKKFCENGTFEMDARIRAPSYKDCLCRSGDIRIVYKISKLGQQIFGLPHCIDKRNWKFYQLDYYNI